MSISPSHRAEIRTLVKRLSEAPIEEARAAAARLRVIGPRAVPSLLRAAKKTRTDRILRILPLIGDPRAVRALSRAFQSGEGDPETIIELLAATGSKAAAKTLCLALPKSPPPIQPAIRAALLVLAWQGAYPEEGLDDVIEEARDLKTRIEARSEDPLCDAKTRLDNPVVTYFDLEPDSKTEAAMRGSVASLLKPREIARMLELDRDPRRLTLLCLLTEERKAKGAIPSLHTLAKRLDETPLELSDKRRPSIVLLATHLHHALAAMNSRIALVELTRLVAGLQPTEVRVELLEALEQIGRRPQVKELVPLAARDDWLGEAACRVISEIAKREGISPRAAVLRPLSKERRREIRRMIDG